MSEKGTSLARFVEHFGLEILNKGDTYDTDRIESTNINRPDLQILGLFDYFDARRIQVMGKAELTYIMKMSETRRAKVFDDLFSYTIPAFVLARNLECPQECLEYAQNHGRTLLRTKERTADFTSHAMEYLSKELAPCITRHGVLLDIYGEGVMITGDSGVGKSEAAIELIMRGHRLVADDAVEIRRISDQLIGTAPEVIRNYIELRGIGVIDVRQLFGMRAVMPESQIDLVVEFEQWDSTKFYDRLGIEDRFIDILEQQFDALQSGWLGIVAITLLGPILEELLFRGGATKALLERYSPRKAIFLSALLFGVFHLNPAQIVAAFFGGLLLAWVYYRTRSLIPCILIHIVNNSISVMLSLTYPDADTIRDVTGTTPYYLLIAVAAMVFVGCFLRIKQVTVPGTWRKDE